MSAADVPEGCIDPHDRELFFKREQWDKGDLAARVAKFSEQNQGLSLLVFSITYPGGVRDGLQGLLHNLGLICMHCSESAVLVKPTTMISFGVSCDECVAEEAATTDGTGLTREQLEELTEVLLCDMHAYRSKAIVQKCTHGSPLLVSEPVAWELPATWRSPHPNHGIVL